MVQKKLLAINNIRIELMDFCRDNGFTLSERGEIGFGRKCVGFSSGGRYVDYTPSFSDSYIMIPDLNDEAMVPDDTVPDAYHKHDCFAVLVHNDQWEVALRQLHAWMQLLQQRGGVKLITFNTKHTGLHAIMHGLSGYCLVSVPFWNKLKARVNAGEIIHPAIPVEQFKEGANAISV